jgi:hypothetical protein
MRQRDELVLFPACTGGAFMLVAFTCGLAAGPLLVTDGNSAS